jgi:hypothetical protein
VSSPAVVIEIAAADENSPYAPMLVSACSEGLRTGGQCALAATKSDASPAVAVVAWNEDGHLSVRVEVGVRRGERSEWLTRQMAFRASDAEIERWRAVGLVIATLVGEVVAAPESKPAARPASTPTAPTAPPSPPPAPQSVAAVPSSFSPRPQSWSLDLGFDLARGASNTLGARGGSLRASRRLGSSVWFLTSSLRYELEPSAAPQVNLAWGWATVGIDATAVVPSARLLIDMRLEPAIGWLHASLGGDAHASQTRLLFGAREGLAATWWLTDSIGLSIGAELQETTQRAIVRLSPEGGSPSAVATEQPLGWGALFALRFRPD